RGYCQIFLDAVSNIDAIVKINLLIKNKQRYSMPTRQADSLHSGDASFMAEHAPHGAVASQRHDDILVLTIDHPPVNALSADVRRGLADAIRAAQSDSGVRAIVLTGAGRNFIAGADIREFGKPPQPPALPDVCNAIEA